ncbi:MAG: haloacid dehalogenase type II [SAR324 cluster bacterium]|nr:haloacid dehalogenase type II [SAR324 cluster bacterium]
MVVSDIKVLTFDVFGTVVDWRGSVIAAASAFGNDKSISVNWEAFTDAWKTCYRPGMDRVNEGKTPWTNVYAIYRAKLEELFPEYGINGVSEGEMDHFNRVWERLDPWPDSVRGLTRLKEKFVLSTLSNSDFGSMVRMAKHAGLPWDCIITAEIAKCYKPDPRVYLTAIALLGCKPEQMMMVAAHNYDLAHAASHGMHTAFIPRPTEYGPGQTTDLAAEGDWDIVADDMEQLADALGA